MQFELNPPDRADWSPADWLAHEWRIESYRHRNTMEETIEKIDGIARKLQAILVSPAKPSGHAVRCGALLFESIKLAARFLASHRTDKQLPAIEQAIRRAAKSGTEFLGDRWQFVEGGA